MERTEYENPKHVTFRDECSAAGLDVIDYHGRSFYHGPAVVVDNIQDAIRATTVNVQWDNMGSGWVVYPA